MENFKCKSLRELQEYLKLRGVTFSHTKKAELVELCEIANSLNIEIDPDGLVEDRGDILTGKLTTHTGEVLDSPQLSDGSYDISLASSVSIFDIYNYLVSFDEYDHAKLRNYHQLEGYSMQQDGYVLDVKCVDYANGYIALKSQVKPRTCDKDPVTKLPYYRTWIIIRTEGGPTSCIVSAYCSCKGGMGGCCRHMVATLFEVLDYTEDFKKKSCTSGPCQWIRRASEAEKLSRPILATDLNTSCVSNPVQDVPRPCDHLSIPATSSLPDPNEFLMKVKEVYPKACILDTKYVRRAQPIQTPSLEVQTPMQKLTSFVRSHKCIVDMCMCSNIFMHYHLPYSDSDHEHVELCTRGQADNSNWFDMRKGLVTASNFKLVCSSTNLTKTGENLLKPQFADSCIPQPIQFGKKYENKARVMYLKSHRYRHRQCKLHVPGLILSKDNDCPFLGCSPDGIIDCKICGRFLLEVKCSFKYKSFHPRTALKMAALCDEDEDGTLSLKPSHAYYYQIQGQMAVAQVDKCVLVFFTYKGIHCVDVDFCVDFWSKCREKLMSFYSQSYFSQLKDTVMSDI